MGERVVTQFGDCLLSLGRSRGLDTQGELVAHLQECGVFLTEENLKNWVEGRYRAPLTFPREFASALNLNYYEMQRLANAFVDGQKKPALRLVSEATEEEGFSQAAG